MTRFLWLKPDAPPSGFREVPKAGMCLSSFTFVMKEGNRSEILLGKYKNVSTWERLTGLDPERVKRHSAGLTIPGSHLKFGEDPRSTGKRVIEEIIQIPVGNYKISEPWAETERWDLDPDPDNDHWDVSFYFNVFLNKEDFVKTPEWYEILGFYDPLELNPSQYARRHEDVIKRWSSVKDKIDRPTMS